MGGRCGRRKTGIQTLSEDVKLSLRHGTCNAMPEASRPLRIQELRIRIRGSAEILAPEFPFSMRKTNLDMTVPGTVILWVSPVNWPAEKPESGKEPGFNAFAARGSGKDFAYDYIIGKMGGQPWGHGHMNTYVQYSPAKFKHVNCIVYGAGQTGKWKNGEWRMLVGNGRRGASPIRSTERSRRHPL